jgi:hypothetical protein
MLGLYEAVNFDIDHPPASWRQIHLGDTRASILAKYPQIGNDLYTLKGSDQLMESGFFGTWYTIYGYNDDNLFVRRLLYYPFKGDHYLTILFEMNDDKSGSNP